MLNSEICLSRFGNRPGLCSVAILCFFHCSIGTSLNLHGQNIDWNNSTGVPDPFFRDGTNWVGGSPPNDNETGRFDLDVPYQVWWDGPTSGIGYLEVNQGTVTFLNLVTDIQYPLAIGGSGSIGQFSDLSVSGSTTELVIAGLNLHDLGGAQLIEGAKVFVDGSHAAGSSITVLGEIGMQVDGTMTISSGAIVENTAGWVGMDPASIGSVEVDGVDSKWISSGELVVGSFGEGSLTIENGGEVSCFDSEIGLFSSVGNLVKVTGIGSEWNIGNKLDVGRAEGSGSLMVENGGLVTNQLAEISSHGTTSSVVTVKDNGSKWISNDTVLIGQFGNVELAISNGGLVRGRRVSIGVQNGQSGTAAITGDGSKLISDMELTVGEFGIGSMDIEQGGVVQSMSGRVGFNSSNAIGTVVVQDAGSLWETTMEMNVGGNGDGHLTVQNGGTVSSADGYVEGDGAHGMGTVTVTGSESEWLNSRDLFLGRVGNGVLNVENGGYVTNRVCFMGLYASGNGQTNVSGAGSQWCSTGGVIVGGTIGQPRGEAEINIADQGLVSISGMLKIWNNGTVNLIGGILVVPTLDVVHGTFNMTDGLLQVETVIGNLRNTGAVLSTGEIPNVTTIDGNLTEEHTATIEAKLGGLDPGMFDQFVISGNLALVDSQLSVSLWHDFAIGPDMQFLIADVQGQLTGQFEGLSEGDVIGTFSDVELFISYNDGQGGPGVRLYTNPDPVVPTTVVVTHGIHASGGVEEIEFSDNLDVSIYRDNHDLQSRTEFEVKAISPVAVPSSLEITLEGSVFARSPVTQTIELFNYDAASWEVVDSRAAAQFLDSRITVAPVGDLSRFVQSGSQSVEARIRYQSTNQRQQFTSNTDQFVWAFGR